jgi:hypothetical protein
MGRSRSKTGRKLVRVRVRVASSGERVVTGRIVESVTVLQEAIQAAERLLDDLSMREVVQEYDQRAAMEADLKEDKHGLALAVIRKRRFPAQKIVILLMQLAHNVLIWAREWLAPQAPHLHTYGIVRLIREVWAIPGHIKLTEQGVLRIRLRRAHPRARDVCKGFLALLTDSHIGVGVG